MTQQYTYQYEFDDQKLHELMPIDEHLNAGGDGDYLLIGKHICQLLLDHCGLKETSHVLDVGCCIGRIATPLTQLIPKGEYNGFDVVLESIAVAKQNIGSKNKNFSFEHVNVYNGAYNPQGTIKPDKFVFPYKTNTFDIVFLTSVFTHMLASDVAHYLSEIARVLKPGGRCLITYFITNDESKRYVANNLSDRSFPVAIADATVGNANSPEGQVSYTEDFLRNLYKLNKLNIQDIKFGWWTGRPDFTSYQDVIIAQKT